MQCYVNKIAA